MSYLARAPRRSMRSDGKANAPGGRRTGGGIAIAEMEAAA